MGHVAAIKIQGDYYHVDGSDVGEQCEDCGSAFQANTDGTECGGIVRQTPARYVCTVCGRRYPVMSIDDRLVIFL